MAVRARRERLDDLPRARRFVALVGGPTDEDSLPRRRVADAGDVERPRHAHAREVRHERPIGVAVDGRLEQAELERLNHVLDGRVILLDERRADRVRPGLHGHSDRGAVFDLVVGELGEQDALPVERHLELLGLAQVGAEHAAAALDEIRANDVLRVDGEVVRERSAAARAERHAGQVLVLRQVAADEVFLLAIRHRRVADREPADLARGRDVALEQHRRNAERARDVVEAEARVVRRQQRRCVDLERQQIADRIRVLGAIDAMQRRAAGVRLALAAMRVELGLEVRQEFALARPGRAAAPKRAASCRRRACARPFPTSRDPRRRSRRRPCRRTGRRTAPRPIDRCCCGTRCNVAAGTLADASLRATRFGSRLREARACREERDADGRTDSFHHSPVLPFVGCTKAPDSLVFYRVPTPCLYHPIASVSGKIRALARCHSRVSVLRQNPDRKSRFPAGEATRTMLYQSP